MIVWGITSGGAGMVAQVRALAATLGVEPEMKKTQLRAPFVYLPNRAFTGPLASLVVPLLEAPLSPLWPQLVISCGRRAAAVALGIQARAPQTRFIHIQDPHIDSRHFDLVVAMAHDRITGPNVIKTRFALHAITSARLDEARQYFAPQFDDFPSPRVAVLLGGSTNKYRLRPPAMQEMILKLQQLLHYSGASLLITPSRRTGAENVALLKQAFASDERVYIYDGREENPYMGMLALADAIIVTDDSVNMMSEAHATGKPLYLLPMPGHADTKPARFAQKLLQDGIAREIGKTLERWDYPRSDEMAQLAEKIKAFI